MRRFTSCDKGASAVEFALIAPVVIMLIMGIFTGGLAYNQKITLTSASREAVRYAATVPTGSSSVTTSWLDSVASRAILSANGELNPGVEGQYTCVAYAGTGSPRGSATDFTKKREQSGSAAPIYTTGSRCFEDGRGTEPRVQVQVQRQSRFNALLFAQTLTLRSDAIARYEAIAP